jgi:hypothetical protein
VAPVPIAVQFWRRIAAVTEHRQELVRSLQRLVGASLITAGKNITATVHITSLPPNEYLAQALYHLRRTLRQKKTLVFVVTGLAGLVLIFSLLEISVRRELAKQATDAAIEGLPAVPSSPQQIEFVDRFVIQPTDSTFLEAVKVEAPTSISEDPQTFRQAFRESVPLPRPRKRR